MRDLLTKRTSVVWLLLVLIATGAVGILWKVAVLDAPPRNAVLIGSAPVATARLSPAPTSVAARQVHSSPTERAVALAVVAPTEPPAVPTPPTTEPPAIPTATTAEASPTAPANAPTATPR